MFESGQKVKFSNKHPSEQAKIIETFMATDFAHDKSP
jgi:hypothetical protein